MFLFGEEDDGFWIPKLAVTLLIVKKMKVRKVQLCSTKEGHHSEEWDMDNKESVEETTNISSSENKEGHMFTTTHENQPLALAVTTQDNSNILLSNVQLVSDIQQPVIWPSDGILRQALMIPEKNIKCEEKPCQSNIENCNGSVPRDFTAVTSSCNTYSSLVTINVTPQQALTNTPGTSQVIMMGELESSQIILTEEAMPTTWQNTERKEVTEATCVTSCTVPIVSSRSFNEPAQLSINDHSPEILVNNEETQFSTLGRISVLNENVLPPLIETHDKKSEHGVINEFGSSNKKNYTKYNKSNKKIQKKINCSEKRILVKPTSSLLSPVALNYRVIDSKNTVVNVVTSSGPVVSNGELLGTVLTNLERSSSPVQIVPNMEYTMKGSTKMCVKMVDSELPVSSSSVVIASDGNSFGATSSVSAQNLNIDHLTVNAKNNFQRCVNGNSENSDMLNYRNHNIINHTGTEASSVLTSDSSPTSTTTVTTSMPNQVRILNVNSPSLIQDSLLVSSVNQMLTPEGQPSLNQRILTPEDDLMNNRDHHTSSLIVGHEFHQQNSEGILTSDMEPHANEIQTTQNDGTYTTQGYTAHILSQLSNASTLPAISSSQVSSVLSALEPKKPTGNMNSVDNLNSCKTRKTIIKNENVSAEFVKTEIGGDPSSMKRKKRTTEQKWKICEFNKHCCYRCCSCMFISLRSEIVDEHFAQEHEVARSDFVSKQLTKRQIKCIACDNVFLSKHALQVHLLQDHSVFGSELPELLNLIMSANKAVKECKRAVVVNEGSTTPVTRPSVTIPVSVNSPCTTTASVQPAVSKHVSTLSPLFCLFNNISTLASKDSPQLAPIKKDTENLMTKEDGENVKKKRHPQGPQSYRRIKSKLKVDDIKLEIKDTVQKCSLNGCSVRLQEQSNMNYHRKCHSGNSSESEALFMCPECSHKSPHWSSLTMHLWKLHNIDMELFSCDKCNYKTNSHSKLMNLHRRIHGDERPFLCDLCGKGFKTTKQLRNHKAMHKKNRAKGKNEDSASSQQKYPCVICGRTFIDRRVLRLHTENVHNKLKSFVCSFCEHAASSRSSLRMHIRQHTGEKPFSCEECEYTTSDHNSLRRHKMRHSGTKPYRCPHCAYACIQSSTYKVHLRTKHPGLCDGLMYSCTLCSFHTVKKDNFLTHSADHALGVDPLRRRRKAVNLTSGQEVLSCGNRNSITAGSNTNKSPVIITVLPEETVCVQDYTEELIVPEVSSHG